MSIVITNAHKGETYHVIFRVWSEDRGWSDWCRAEPPYDGGVNMRIVEAWAEHKIVKLTQDHKHIFSFRVEHW